MELYERFKEVRKVLKYTQKQYAEELGISQAHLSSVENGKDNPSLTLLKLVCSKFGVSEKWLIEEDTSMFVKDCGFNIYTDEGLEKKYILMKDFFEKLIKNQTGSNLKYIIQAYSHFVSILTMPNLNEDNQKKYLEAICNINDILEHITYQSYMLKSVSNNNYKLLLNYKTNMDSGLQKINANIKQSLSCYLEEYEKDLTL